MSRTRSIHRTIAVACSALVLIPSGAMAATAPVPVDREHVTVVHSDPARGQSAAISYASLMAIPSLDNGIVPAVKAPLYAPKGACPPSRCEEGTAPRRACSATGLTARSTGRPSTPRW